MLGGELLAFDGPEQLPAVRRRQLFFFERAAYVPALRCRFVLVIGTKRLPSVPRGHLHCCVWHKHLLALWGGEFFQLERPNIVPAMPCWLVFVRGPECMPFLRSGFLRWPGGVPVLRAWIILVRFRPKQLPALPSWVLHTSVRPNHLPAVRRWSFLGVPRADERCFMFALPSWDSCTRLRDLFLPAVFTGLILCGRRGHFLRTLPCRFVFGGHRN